MVNNINIVAPKQGSKEITPAFLDALERSLGIPRDQIVQTINTGANDQRGTWVHPQVATHLAQWQQRPFIGMLLHLGVPLAVSGDVD
jgi:hypothetical protein